MDRIIDAVHVRRLPEVFEQGNLYVADDPPVAGHLCCCGCGERIVLSIGIILIRCFRMSFIPKIVFFTVYGKLF